MAGVNDFIHYVRQVQEPFDLRPLTDVDLLVFSALAYMEFEATSLGEACRAGVGGSRAGAGQEVEADSGDRVSLMMSKVKGYLQNNYMYDVSLDSLGDILRISPSYLSSTFKKCFGVGFLDYLTELRVQAAKGLLADPLRSTAEVASLVGYESASYFTRAFKKKTGQTPTEYRQQIAWNRKAEP